MLIVDDNWEKLSGEVNAVTDTESAQYNTENLRVAIEHQLVDEGAGERIFKAHQKRLEKLAEDAGEDDSDRTEPSNSEDY
jgi:hypothetical protein